MGKSPGNEVEFIQHWEGPACMARKEMVRGGGGQNAKGEEKSRDPFPSCPILFSFSVTFPPLSSPTTPNACFYPGTNKRDKPFLRDNKKNGRCVVRSRNIILLSIRCIVD